jgi:hypothetical protein
MFLLRSVRKTKKACQDGFGMSEWYDNQKKPSSNFRQLLQEQNDKDNPRRMLTSEEAKRLSKLEAIAEKLKRGENVQNRQLQTWLSEDEYAQIEAEWQEQLELRSELKAKPSELKLYEEKLKQATFNYNRAEGYSSKGKHTTAETFYNRSESLCEDALEILQELLHSDSSLRVWFDRDISFEVGGDLSADIVSLPRLVTSRSHEKLIDDSRLTSKKSVKLAVVERAMHNIGRDTTRASKDNLSKLDKFLNTDD